MNVQTISISVIVLLAIGAGSYLVMRSDEDTMKSDTMTETDMMKGDESGEPSMMDDETGGTMGEMMGAGSYAEYAPEKLALAKDGDVVLYFHADWCPICRPLDAAFKTRALPHGVHILKVDYDNSADLKKKYGVTYQHTFVQVDSNGTMIAKWGDASIFEQVIAKIQ